MVQVILQGFHEIGEGGWGGGGGAETDMGGMGWEG